MSLRSERTSVHLPFSYDDTQHLFIISIKMVEKNMITSGHQLLRAWKSCFNPRHKSYTTINAQSCQPDTVHDRVMCAGAQYFPLTL